MSDPFYVVLLMLLGLGVGSFLNVCIYRLPREESIAFPFSHCPDCGRSLSWCETVPVLSFLWLGGRCRTCQGAIRFYYPLIELLTPLLFLLQYGQQGWQSLLIVRLVFVSGMLVLFMIDLNHRILPNVITIPGVCVGLVLSHFFGIGLSSAVLGAALGAGLSLLIAQLYFWIRREDGLGMGDVKMLGMIGAFLGWQSTLLTLFLASLFGSLIGLLVLAFRYGGRRYPLPFGSFLAVAAIVTTFIGEPLIVWYRSFL